jgi:hypothetical protein
VDAFCGASGAGPDWPEAGFPDAVAVADADDDDDDDDGEDAEAEADAETEADAEGDFDAEAVSAPMLASGQRDQRMEETPSVEPSRLCGR